MIAKLSKGTSIKGALKYNENKVAEGSAELLNAHKFGKEKDDLSFKEKVNKFKRYTDQNTRANVNSYHYSLNFHENDRVDNKQLKEIADRFMKAVKFGYQPYLVYRHHDSGHPHIHIVSTNIQANGKRINDSWNARPMRQCAEEIERDYGLTLTGNNLKKLGQKYEYPEHDNRIDPVLYPEKELRNKISDVVAALHKEYKYKSFEDYNQLLGEYNLKAIRLNGRNIRQDDIQSNGLAFQTTKNGKETGVPIYASEILHLGKFNIQEVDKAIKANSKERLSGKLENIIGDFLKENITYKPSSLHAHLQARGFKPLGNSKLYAADTRYLDQENKSVVSLSDISDPKISFSLGKKRNSFDMTRGEGEEITGLVKELYHQARKKNPEKYYLESRLIKDIDNTNFKATAAMAATVGGKHSSEKVFYQLESFLEFKKKSLQEIEQKEKQYFSDRCRKAYQYTSHLNALDREKLLEAVDIKTEALGQLILFEHTKYPELEAEGMFDTDVVRGTQRTNLLKEKPALSDIRMIREYAGMVNSEQARDKAAETSVSRREFPAGYDLLKEKDKVDFQARFTKKYIEKISWDSSKNMKALIEDLAGMGVVVGKDDYLKEYVIGLYGFDKKSYLEVSKSLNKMLSDVSYDEKAEQRIIEILDDYLKSRGEQVSSLQPLSMALLKEPLESHKNERSLLGRLSDMDGHRFSSKFTDKASYGDATESLDEEKRRRKRKRIS